MRQKTKSSHTTKEFYLSDVDSTKPPDASGFLKAVQLSSALPFIARLRETPDRFLRELCDPNKINPRTKSPWIPKPIVGKYAVTPTILGLLEYFHALADSSDSLPRRCNSMEHAAQLYFILSKPALQYARKHSQDCAAAVDSAGRITDILPFLKFFGPLVDKLITGGVGLLEGFEELDKDIMAARVMKQQETKLILENNETLKLLRTADDFEDEIAAPLALMQSGLDNFERRTGHRIKNKLLGYGLDESQAQTIIALAVEGIKEPRQKLITAMENSAKIREQTEEKLKAA